MRHRLGSLTLYVFSKMVVAAVILAFCVLVRALAQRRSAVVLLLIAGVLAIPLGVCLATWWGPVTPRTRIAVSFVGYRVPLALIDDCAAPEKLWVDHGVWIGGGSRYDDDAAPDVITIPGFRPRLLHICSQGTPLAAKKFVVRAVQPGLELVGVAGSLRTEVPTDAATQRVVLDAIGDAKRSQPRWDGKQCVQTIPAASIQTFAEEKWRSDDAARMRRSRARLLAMRQRLFGPPPGSDVFCLDLSSGKPGRCTGDPNDARNLLFLWREERSFRPSVWSGLTPLNAPLSACRGAAARTSADAVELAPHDVLPDKELTADAIESLPGVSVRMISRRFTASTADRNVRRAVKDFSPAPYRLGSPRTIRFAHSESDLLLFVREPSVQHRLADLFGGRSAESLPPGSFDVVFGDPGLGLGLITDLAAEAEEFLPKPLLEKWRSRVSVNETANEYLERSRDALPRTHHFGEIATFGSDVQKVRPLVLIERVVPPVRAWLIPLLAALLLIVPLVDLMRVRRPAGMEWDLAAIAFAFLTFRWLLATRALLDAPESDARRFDWSLAGTALFLAPILLSSSQPWIQRWWQRSAGGAVSGRSGRFMSTLSTLAAGTGAVVWVIFSNATAWTAAKVLGYAVLTATAASAGVACALHLHRLTQRLLRTRNATTQPSASAGSAPPSVQPAPVSAAPAQRANPWQKLGKAGGAAPRRSAFRLPSMSAPLAALRGNLNPSQLFGLRPLGRWFVSSWWMVALACGGLLLIVRGGAMLVGVQEQLFSVRLDVLFLPAVAAGFALLSRDQGRHELQRLGALILYFALALFGVGYAVNDLGLLWVGAMAIVLAVPFVSARPLTAALLAILLFFGAFLSPKFASRPFLWALGAFGGTTLINESRPDELAFRDELQVQRDRDHYRMLDTVQSELVEEIPSQLAREVVLDRERVRYQATSGAWRAGFRETATPGNDMTGAGYLRAKPIIGQGTFRDAARSDYVYPLYVRSEFGWAGLLALAALYMTMFVASLFGNGPARRPSRLAVWSLALAAGTALFMIGGTSALFPFSGKWPLFLAFASESDLALGLALLLLGTTEETP